MLTKKEVLSWLKENETSTYYLRDAAFGLVNKKNAKRDLGKLFAESNEQIQCDWINENTSLNVIKRDDVGSDANESGYDLNTSDGILKIQAKLRAVDLHLEQTRRKSNKNKLSSDTGHVTYSVGEADVFLFSRPDVNNYLQMKSWTYIAIPESALINPSNPKYLIPRIPKRIWKNYIGRATEILENAYLLKQKTLNE